MIPFLLQCNILSMNIKHIAHNQTNGYGTLQSRLRVLLYFFMNVANDIETQRKG